MTPAIFTNGKTVGAAPKDAKKFKFSVEDLERLVVKIGHQLGNDRLDVESQVACLRQFQKVGPKQIGPILDTIFEARRKFFLAKFQKFGVPVEVVAKWDSQSVGKPSGKVFAEAGELIAKAKAKLPICRCGRHERTYVHYGEFYSTCWECAKERKSDHCDARRVPARLAAPSAADQVAFVGSSAGQMLMGTAMLGAMAEHATDVEGLIFEVRNAFDGLPVVTLPPRQNRRAEKFAFKKKVTPRKNGKTRREKDNGKWQRHLANKTNFAAQQAGHQKGKSGEIKAKGSSKKAKK